MQSTYLCRQKVIGPGESQCYEILKQTNCSGEYICCFKHQTFSGGPWRALNWGPLTLVSQNTALLADILS